MVPSAFREIFREWRSLAPEGLTRLEETVGDVPAVFETATRGKCGPLNGRVGPVHAQSVVFEYFAEILFGDSRIPSRLCRRAY
jgi:hypothetical protein